MGKYENTVKYVQLNKLLEEKNYKAALEMAEGFDTDKVRELHELKLLAEVYRKNELYDKAKDIYKLIYEQLGTRRILYRLIILCIKSGDLNEASSLYQEYLTKDKDSIDRYTLKYRLDKESGAAQDVIIEDIKAILNEEYSEKWAYELAKQYHKAGRAEECVEECHKIMQWFFGSETARKASLLRQYYTNEIDEDIIENFQQSISDDVNKYMQQEKENDVADAAPMPEGSRKEPRSTEIPDDIQPAVFASGEAGGETTEPVTFASGEAEDKAEPADSASEAAGDGGTAVFEEIAPPEDDEAADTVEELSKYGKDIPYMHLKYLFKGLETDVRPPLNIAIAASEPTYYLTIVKKITKQLQNKNYFGSKKIKIAKIGAEKLNRLNLEDQVSELLGSCVMIENASAMNAQTVNSIIRVLDAHAADIVIILIDAEEALSKLLFKEEILKNQIKYFVIV